LTTNHLALQVGGYCEGLAPHPTSKIYNAKKPKIKEAGRNDLRRHSKHKWIMNIGCWNVQGLSNKTDTIPLEVKKYNLDIIALSETKKKGCSVEVLGNYLHLWSG
jgi:hypothetical protein